MRGLLIVFKRLSYPRPTATGLQLFFTPDGIGSSVKRLCVYKLPRSGVFLGMPSEVVCRIVVLGDPMGKIIRLADVKLTIRVDEDVNKVHEIDKKVRESRKWLRRLDSNQRPSD